jgi:hypothetical protein
MTEEQEQAQAPEERPLWKLDRGEQRVLLITFVGGLASIVVAAIIIGLAVAFARYLNSTPHTTWDWVGIGLFAVFFAVGVAALIWFQGYESRHPLPGRAHRVASLIMLIGMAAACPGLGRCPAGIDRRGGRS